MSSLSSTILAASAAVTVVAASAAADLMINEMFINPPGTDNGLEFFEITGTSGTSLAGWSLLVIEGDSTGAGVIDAAISLSGSIGANGLFLHRDGTTIIDTSPDAGVQGPDPLTFLQVGDFDPDIENGTNTFLLVYGFSGAVGQDLDTNNDGTFDTVAWNSVADAVGFSDGGSADRMFGQSVGGYDIAYAGYTPDTIARFGGQWIGTDVLTTDGVFFTYESAVSGFDGWVTAGAANVPAPGALALLGLAGICAGRRRA